VINSDSIKSVHCDRRCEQSTPSPYFRQASHDERRRVWLLLNQETKTGRASIRRAACDDLRRRPVRQPRCGNKPDSTLLLLFLLRSGLDFQLFQLVDDLLAVILCVDLFLNVKNLAFFADEEGDSTRKASVFVVDAVSRGNFSVRIAKDRVVQIQRLGEVCVLFDGVTAGSEVRNVELFQGLATLTEGFALSRSATGKRFGEPRDDDDFLIFKLRQFVVLAVAAFQFEGRRFVAFLQVFRLNGTPQSHGNGQAQGENLCESHVCLRLRVEHSSGDFRNLRRTQCNREWPGGETVAATSILTVETENSHT